MPRTTAILILFVPLAARAAGPDAGRVEFFEKKIRPVLVEHCAKCHSAEAQRGKKLKGGLMLDTRAGMLRGGDTGPAVVPGNVSGGTLLKSLRHEGDVHMLPRGKLPAAVIKDFERWVADGAADPRGDTAVEAGAPVDIDRGKQFWAFQVPREPAVPVVRRPGVAVRTPVDAFVQAKWDERGLTPAAAAEPRTLLRRVTPALVGLPPTPEETDAFVKDPSPAAFAEVVERLLARPQYGETWARHWLDVARYAEDQAHTFGVKPKTQAWRYRDWVIDAFNRDLPYDRFVKMQIAGDLLPDAPADPFARLAGLGFLGLGAEYYRDGGCGARADADELDDRVDTLTRGFLGLTVACARCHDHKYDPVGLRDYYALAGIYAGTKLSDAPLAPPDVVKKYADAQAQVKAAEERLKKAQAEQKAKAADKDRVKELAAKVDAGKAEVERLKKAIPPAPPVAHVVSGNGSGMKVLLRGNPATPGEAVPKGFLRVLGCGKPAGADYTRLDLAEAVASPDNPLTARVIVNRVWAWHFGRGLVATPGNFGTLGERPSHPELLDWLAVNFVKHGWSLKWLQRQIVLSSTYALDSRPVPASEGIDAANVYLWRANRRRLDVETWRDSLLAVSGTLDPAVGGPTFDLRDPNARRRTVYAKVSRHELDGLLRLFDFPDANVTADRRVTTTVPQQQLFALNSPFMAAQAKAFAGRVQGAGATDAERVGAAYRLAFGRPPEPREAQLAEGFLKLPARAGDTLTRWQQLAQALLASNELLYVD